MALSGIAMMLKQFGIDPDKLIVEFTEFKNAVAKTLSDIEAKHTATLKAVSELQAIAETNQKMLMEVVQWKRVNNPTVVLNQPLPPHTPPPPPNQ